MDKKQSKLLRDCVVVTAFLEGVSVLVVEIAGARALAPFFGTTLTVWTSQITATLLFLALGYGVGGLLSRRQRDASIVAVFCVAGAWLGLFPLMRSVILDATGKSFGVAGGSFVSSCLLFGPPLLCMGAVSPLLIERLDRIRSGAGSAAGTLFFINTIGGLMGGWLTALWLIPNVSLRLALSGVGAVLILIGIFWAVFLRVSRPWMPAAALVLCAASIGLTWRSPTEIQVGDEVAKILYRSQSNVGLVQVLEYDKARVLLLDGVTQGGMFVENGLSSFGSTVYQSAIAHRFHPEAKSALLLGIGAGLVGKQLVERGVQVTAIEVEQKVADVAREYFGFPESVRVIVEDGRTYLNRAEDKYDLVFLDAFAGESIPWYLTTVEAMQRIRDVLNPGGRMVINTITRSDSHSVGIQRLEAVLLEVFDEGKVFLNTLSSDLGLTGVTIVAGNQLVEHEGELPNRVPEKFARLLPVVYKSQRPAASVGRVGTDDWHDLDYADRDVRSVWRQNVLTAYSARSLED